MDEKEILKERFKAAISSAVKVISEKFDIDIQFGKNLNSRKESFYKIMVFYGFGIGFPISILGLGLSYFFEWNWLYSQFPDRIPNTISTPFISYGYIGMICCGLEKNS